MRWRVSGGPELQMEFPASTRCWPQWAILVTKLEMFPATIPATAARPTAPATGDGVAIALVAMAAFALHGRDAWHGQDAQTLLGRFTMGSAGGAPHHHTLYLLLLRVAHALTAPLGISAYQNALLASAAGSAAGVFFTHAAAARLGADRGSAAFAALLVLSWPAVGYFATIVEVHGVQLASIGVSWFLLAAWARRPTAGTALIAGLGLVLAHLAHPIAVFLGLSMWPLLLLGRQKMPIRDAVFGGAIAFAALLAGVLAIPPFVRWLGGTTDDSYAFDFLRMRIGVPRAHGHLVVVAREWLLPCLPASLVLPALALRRQSRAAAMAMLVATFPFVAISCLILMDHEWERGAYLTMVAGPTSIVVAWNMRSSYLRMLTVAVGVAATLGLGATLQPSVRTVATKQAVERAAAGHDVLWLVGDMGGPDGEAWMTHFPRTEAVMLANFIIDEPGRVAANLRIVANRMADRAAVGVRTIVTSTAADALEAVAKGHPGAEQAFRWLQSHRGEALATFDGVTVFAVRSGD